MYHKWEYLFVLLISIIFCSFSQSNELDFSDPLALESFSIPDSLEQKSFEYLEEHFYKYASDFDKTSLYIKSFIKKASIEKDQLNLTVGYFLLSVIYDDSLELIYLNKSISLAKNLNNPKHPALAYYNKGNHYFKKANYKKSLDNFLFCLELSLKNNILLANETKFKIGSLKSRMGKNEEALAMFKDYHHFITTEKSGNYSEYDKLVSLFSISESYIKLKKYAKAREINKEGITRSLAIKDRELYHYFVMNSGVNLFFEKKYSQSIDSLYKALPVLDEIGDKSNVIFSNFYLGKAYYAKNNFEKAIEQFHIVDELFKDYKDFFPEITFAYKTLISYYKENNNKEKEFFYLNRLIKVDSVINTNYNYINEKIIKDYDTSLLVKEKEQLIEELDSSNSYKTKSILFLTILLAIISIFLIYYYKKKAQYQLKYDQLIRTNKKLDIRSVVSKVSVPTLSDEITNKIEVALQNFEKEKGYQNQDISMNTLAKTIGTNSKYLSLYVNYHKGKKFTDYINDLRIDDCIENIKIDKKLREYKIKAIAESAGFSNPITFSQAFYKKTGIKPSYFIKKIKEDNK